MADAPETSKEETNFLLAAIPLAPTLSGAAPPLGRETACTSLEQLNVPLALKATAEQQEQSWNDVNLVRNVGRGHAPLCV